MIPWERLFAYLLILVMAGVLGWLPFRLLEYISLVDQTDTANAGARRTASDSRVACPACGDLNGASYSSCGSCGGQLPTGE